MFRKAIIATSLLVVLVTQIISAQSNDKKATTEVTLIDVFEVEPENQQKVADILRELTEQLIKKQPGYVSATVYKDTDGKRIFNIGKWRSQEQFQAILSNKQIMDMIMKAASLSKSFTPLNVKIIYEDAKNRK